ncbi:MAG: Gfo/Idh/MocA family protein [Promethearchaeota archaeon]
MKKVKIGLLGSGFLQDFHMRGYAEIPGAEIVAVGSHSESHAKAFSKKWNIPSIFHGDSAIEDLCSFKGIDAVSIGIPNDLHLPAAKLAAENGKHVICEKPLGRTATEAREMLKAVEKAGVIHCYAENQVFFPLHSHAFDAIEKGVVGDVYWVRSREAHGGPHADHFWDINRSGGGVGIDMGCHSIEVARKSFGNDVPEEVLMWGETLVHENRTQGEDNCVILVKYKHKQLGQAENSWSARAGLDLRTEIYGKEGVLFMDNTRETGIKIFSNTGMDYVVEKGESTRGWMYPVPNEHVAYGYYHELKHFIECIANDKEPIETFRDGVVVNAILDAGYKSMKEKRWIKVEP